MSRSSHPKRRGPSAADIAKAKSTPPEHYIFKTDQLVKYLEVYKKYLIKTIHVTGLPSRTYFYGIQTIHWRTTLQIHVPDRSGDVVFILVDHVLVNEFRERWKIEDQDFPIHL